MDDICKHCPVFTCRRDEEKRLLNLPSCEKEYYEQQKDEREIETD